MIVIETIIVGKWQAAAAVWLRQGRSQSYVWVFTLLGRFVYHRLILNYPLVTIINNKLTLVNKIPLQAHHLIATPWHILHPDLPLQNDTDMQVLVEIL